MHLLKHQNKKNAIKLINARICVILVQHENMISKFDDNYDSRLDIFTNDTLTI